MHMHHFLKPLLALFNPRAKHEHRSLNNYPCHLLFLSPEFLSKWLFIYFSHIILYTKHLPTHLIVQVLCLTAE